MRKQPGFLTANFHRSLDGTRVVNYVQWTSLEAGSAVHKNPKIIAAFASYKDLVVSLDLRYYEVAFTYGQPTTIKAHNGLTTLINVFIVEPEHQQQLLEVLVQVVDPMMRKQAGYLSTNFHRSLDGTRIVNYSQWSSKEAYEAAESSFNRVAGGKQSEQEAPPPVAQTDKKFSSTSLQGIQPFMSTVKDMVKHVGSHLYEVDFTADAHGLST